MNVLILAAGFGTRLYPLTRDTPKSLIKIGDKPIIEYILEKVCSIGCVDKIFIASNNKFYISFLEWLEEFGGQDKIKILNNGISFERDSEGAIADLKKSLRIVPDDDLLVLAGDSLFDFDLNEMIKISDEKKSSVVALKKIYDEDLVKKYSCVLLGNDGKIDYFEEKPRSPVSNICALAFYYVLREDVLKIRNGDFGRKNNLGDVVSFLRNDGEIYGCVYDKFWVDVGDFQELEKASHSLIVAEMV